jgi:CheY-like chemotaxis protein
MGTLLIVEDGTEYLEFFRLFLKDEHQYLHAQAGEAALRLLADEAVDLVVLDMRFDRSDASELLGDVTVVAGEYFGGDANRAQRYIEENQGTLILADLRKAGHALPVLFVADMPARKVENLRKLYGAVRVVPNFDAAAIRAAIAAALDGGPR